MRREDIKHIVQNIFRDLLDDSSFVLAEDMSTMNVHGWGSLTHIGLVNAIEKHYKIRFAVGELDDLKDVRTMLDAIQEKLTNND